ncbi:hypothetical protein EPN44_14320 [bacterium]|nr:MAG: hypothetical protein EPN44_14320 [bacterium]
MSALVMAESGADPYAVHDNAYNDEYVGLTRSEAVALASTLVDDGPASARCIYARAKGRSCTVDLGLAQINSSNLPHYGLSVADVFDSCTNLRVGANLLGDAWKTALRESRDTAVWAKERALYARGPTASQVILRAALSIYNSNSAFASPEYVERVVAASGSRYVEDVVAAAERARNGN